MTPTVRNPTWFVLIQMLLCMKHNWRTVSLLLVYFFFEYFYVWLAEEAKYIKMLSSILELAASFFTFWVNACAKSPSWLTAIKFAEVLIWNECFAVDNRKIDRLFLGSILDIWAYFLLKDESSTDICHSWLWSAGLYSLYEDEYSSMLSIWPHNIFESRSTIVDLFAKIKDNE